MNIPKVIVAILFLAESSFALQVAATHDIEHQFCWKDTYGRGIGTILPECGAKEKIAFFLL